MTPANEFSTLPTAVFRLFIVVVGACAAMMVYLAGAKGTHHWFWPLLLAAFLSGLAWWSVRRWRSGHSAERLAGALLSATVLVLVLVVPELALRTAGFRFEAGIGFAPDGAFRRYVTDPELFWRWGQGALNSLGYPAPEPVVPKPADTFRILYLGDSCTWDSYPEVVEALLAPTLAARGRVIETVNLAVPGYSSHQGRVLAEKHGTVLEPDLVVIMFGWNDQWRAVGAIDADKKVGERDDAGNRSADALMRRLKLLQGVAWIVARRGSPGVLLEESRVPPHAFVENMTTIGSVFRTLNRPVVFMTPPTSHSRSGVPDALRRAFAQHGDTIMAKHRMYTALTRDVAAGNGWLLLDLEHELAHYPIPQRIFTSDGIHYTRNGKAVIGAIVARYIEDRLLPDEPVGATAVD